MKRMIMVLAALGTLSACGVDGSPTHPEPRPEPGVSISGTVEIGISGGS